MSTVEALRPGWAPGTTVTQVAAVAGRSIRRTARQPAMAIPPLVFPVALMLVNAAGLEPSTLLPGFPTDSFLAFALAVRLDEGVGLADVVRGIDAEGLALHDVELRSPTLDDVFLAKTGRTLEGAAEEDEEPAAARRR